MADVERLDYANGRRLDAADLRLEQRYHIGMRRLLNRSLFTPGVVDGLQIRTIDSTHVEVESGLAIDALGREIVLDAARRLAVPAQPPTRSVRGYFLVATYSEERRRAGGDVCAAPGALLPARVREGVELHWSEQLPSPAACDPLLPDSLDCGVALGLVRLTGSCQIEEIEIGLRGFAHPVHTSQASAVAFEGEKDIDKDNAKKLRFAVRGGVPSAVTLYLWGDKFSSLYYTEMGQHDHTITKGTLPLSKDSANFPAHRHTLSSHTHRPTTVNSNGRVETEPYDLSHRHEVQMVRQFEDATNTPWPGSAILTEQKPWNDVAYHDVSPRVFPGTGPKTPYIQSALQTDTRLELALALTAPRNEDGTASALETGDVTAAPSARDHSHTLEADVKVTLAGSPQYTAGSNAAYEFLADLEVTLDGTPITTEILARMAPQTIWKTLGDGSAGHRLNTIQGTGPIDLLEVAASVGQTIGMGPHSLEFSVAAGGGKVLYNLYVE